MITRIRFPNHKPDLLNNTWNPNSIHNITFKEIINTQTLHVDLRAQRIEIHRRKDKGRKRYLTKTFITITKP